MRLLKPIPLQYSLHFSLFFVIIITLLIKRLILFMHPKIAKRITNNAKAHMDFTTRGVLPTLSSANKTPLWILLSSMSSRSRFAIKGVKLSPKLGYNSSMQFSNAEQLFTWLGSNQKFGSWESRPCNSYCIQSFRKNISINDLMEHSCSNIKMENI